MSVLLPVNNGNVSDDALLAQKQGYPNASRSVNASTCFPHLFHQSLVHRQQQVAQFGWSSMQSSLLQGAALHRRPLALHSPGPASCSRCQFTAARPCRRGRRAWRPCASAENAEAEQASSSGADAGSTHDKGAAEPRIKRTVASLNMLLGVEDDPVDGKPAEKPKPDKARTRALTAGASCGPAVRELTPADALVGTAPPASKLSLS
jgi:hypothetical protein